MPVFATWIEYVAVYWVPLTLANVGAPLVTVRFGEVTATNIELLQLVPVQLGSPPPVTTAVLLPFAAFAVTVTGIVNVTALPAPVPMPEAIGQVTAWPVLVQPPVSVPMVRPVVIVSVTEAAAEVAAEPLLVTLIVYVAG